MDATFLDMMNFYDVMELENGGDLHTFIHGSYYKPNEEIWKFIAVNIMFGLSQLEDVSIFKLFCHKKPFNLLQIDVIHN